MGFDKHELYLYLTISLVQNVLKKSSILSDKILLTASKRETNKNLNEKFIKGIEAFFDNEILVEIQIPQNEKGLQIVDFCSWGIFRKYEFGDDSFYEIFEEKLLGIVKG